MDLLDNCPGYFAKRRTNSAFPSASRSFHAAGLFGNHHSFIPFPFAGDVHTPCGPLKFRTSTPLAAEIRRDLEQTLQASNSIIAGDFAVNSAEAH